MTRLLIINADDLGYDPAIDQGILEALRFGVVSSTTLMVNAPHSAAAAREARGFPIGLHLNLARFPATWAAFPVALLAGGELSEAHAAELPADVVEHETISQLRWFETLVGTRPTHIDVHKHLHRHRGILAGLSRVARARGLPVRSLDADMRRLLRRDGVLTNDHFLGEAGSEAYWTLERLAAASTDLPEDGVIELMCHPGYSPRALSSGYGPQREVELATFKHPKARELLANTGVVRANYGSAFRTQVASSTPGEP